MLKLKNRLKPVTDLALEAYVGGGGNVWGCCQHNRYDEVRNQYWTVMDGVCTYQEC